MNGRSSTCRSILYDTYTQTKGGREGVTRGIKGSRAGGGGRDHRSESSVNLAWRRNRDKVWWKASISSDECERASGWHARRKRAPQGGGGVAELGVQWVMNGRLGLSILSPTLPLSVPALALLFSGLDWLSSTPRSYSSIPPLSASFRLCTRSMLLLLAILHFSYLHRRALASFSSSVLSFSSSRPPV